MPDAERLGYEPQAILAGLRICDGMGKFTTEEPIKLMILEGISIHGTTVSFLRLTI